MDVSAPPVYDPSIMRHFLLEHSYNDIVIHQEGTSIGIARFMLETLRKMWEKGELCDYTIQVEDKEFKVHKLVMAAFSDYFRRMFSGSLRESSENFIELKGVSAAGLEPVIKLIYEGETLAVTEDNIVDVLSTASFLHIPIVIHLCVEHIADMIDCDNCIDVLNLAFMYSLQGPEIALDKKAVACIQANWKKIMKDGHITRLSHDALNFLISQTVIGVSDFELFNAIKTWIEYHFPDEVTSDKQKDEIYETLKLLHFPLMGYKELEKIIETCPFMLSDARCCQLVAEAQVYQSQPIHKRIITDSPRTNIRNEPCVVSLSGFLVDDTSDLPTDALSHESFAYIDGSQQWVRLPDSEYSFGRGGHTVVNNFLIICGGCGSGSLSGDECYVYDPRFGKWSSLAPLNCVRQNFSLVFCAGHLYAIGGTCNDTIEQYDFDTDSWTLYDHMDTMLWDHSACEYNGTIYISGGREGFGEESDRMRCYDPVSKSWSEKAAMLSPTAGHTMLTRLNYYHQADTRTPDELIFVFNVANDDISHWGSVTRYNPETNQWMIYNLWQMPGRSQICTIEDRVYYINGRAKASRLVGPTDEDDIDEFGQVTGVCVCLAGTIETGRYQTQLRLDPYPRRFIDSPTCCTLSLPPDVIALASPVCSDER